MLLILLLVYNIAIGLQSFDCPKIPEIYAATKWNSYISLFHDKWVSKVVADYSNPSLVVKDYPKAVDTIWVSLKRPVVAAFHSQDRVYLIHKSENGIETLVSRFESSSESYINTEDLRDFIPNFPTELNSVLSAVSIGDTVWLLVAETSTSSEQTLLEVNLATKVFSRRSVTGYKRRSVAIYKTSPQGLHGGTLFYGPIHFSFLSLTSDALKELVVAPKSVPIKVPFGFNEHWMGCPQDFCYEGRLDAIARLERGEIFIFSGRYYWEIDKWPLPKGSLGLKKGKLLKERWFKIEGHVDCAFWLEATLIKVIKGNTVFILNVASNAIVESKLAMDLVGWDPIGNKAKAVVFLDQPQRSQKLYLFFTTKGGTLKVTEAVNQLAEGSKEAMGSANDVNVLLKGWPQHETLIDAALEVEEKIGLENVSFCYFFVQNHYYKIQTEDLMVGEDALEPQLFHENIFNCKSTPDAYSHPLLKEFLGVDSFRAFIDLRRRVVTGYRTPLTTLGTTSEKGPKDKFNLVLALIVIAAGLVVFAMIGLGVVSYIVIQKKIQIEKENNPRNYNFNRTTDS